MSIIEKIKIDFSERKKIVDFKRHRERVQRENEKIGQRVTTGITRVYRSCDNIRQDNDMKFLEKDKNIILKDYVESSNPFTFIVKVKDRIKETDQNYTFECLNYEDYLINKAYLLINTFKDYFDNLNKKAEVKFIPDKFSIKIKIDEDEGNENENLEVDYNCYLTEESFSLKQMVFKELKFNVELQKYDEDKLIVEFKKKSGDRFELYTLFEDFINKISN